jgi:hypothetical protein
MSRQTQALHRQRAPRGLVLPRPASGDLQGALARHSGGGRANLTERQRGR